MYCTKCGNELQEESRFCTNCGAPIEIPQQDEEKPLVSVQGNNQLKKEDIYCAKEHKKRRYGLIAIIIILIVSIIGVSGTAFWYLGGDEILNDIFRIWGYKS